MMLTFIVGHAALLSTASASAADRLLACSMQSFGEASASSAELTGPVRNFVAQFPWRTDVFNSAQFKFSDPTKLFDASTPRYLTLRKPDSIVISSSNQLERGTFLDVEPGDVGDGHQRATIFRVSDGKMKLVGGGVCKIESPENPDETFSNWTGRNGTKP